MSAREEILSRVRGALGPERRPEVEIPRAYDRVGEGGLAEFVERLGHYDAGVTRVPASELPKAIEAVLTAHDARRLVVPEGVPEDWVRDREVLRDQPPLTPAELDAADGVLTTCALAIAPTGTIVLDGGAGMGRRALSLVPDFHLCVVGADQLVGCVPEAIARLEPTRPLTFISGPSATVDIEMVRVKGVHGPRRLEVIVAE